MEELQSFFLKSYGRISVFRICIRRPRTASYLVELVVLISIRAATIVPSVGQGTVPHDTMAGHSQAIVPAAHAARIIR